MAVLNGIRSLLVGLVCSSSSSEPQKDKLVYERTKKQSHLDTVRYELDMLTFTYDALTKQEIPVPARHVYLEAFLLHYRNVVQFFAGNTKKHRAGDLSTHQPQVWAGRELTKEESDLMRGPAQELEDRYWPVISQFLQHCTERRYLDSKDWDISMMYSDLLPVMEAFEKAFKRPEPVLVTATLGDASSTHTVTRVRSTFPKDQ